MKYWRVGINLLVLISLAFMIAAMYQPWWSFTYQGTKTSFVYPYLIDGPASEMIGYKRSPQMTLLTGVLIACILLTLSGILFRGRAKSALLIVAGALTLVGAWRLLARVAGVAARFDIPIQGHGRAVYEGFAQIEVSTQLELGSYLILTGGVLAILAGLLHLWMRIREQRYSA